MPDLRSLIPDAAVLLAFAPKELGGQLLTIFRDRPSALGNEAHCGELVRATGLLQQGNVRLGGALGCHWVLQRLTVVPEIDGGGVDDRFCNECLRDFGAVSAVVEGRY